MYDVSSFMEYSLQAGKYYPAFSSFHFLFFAENSAPGDHTKENDGSRNNDDKQKHPHISGEGVHIYAGWYGKRLIGRRQNLVAPHERGEYI